MSGPAFPAVYPQPVHQGLTKREWFAGQALFGLIVRADDRSNPEATADWAFAIADAMLAESEKQP